MTFETPTDDKLMPVGCRYRITIGYGRKMVKLCRICIDWERNSMIGRGKGGQSDKKYKMLLTNNSEKDMFTGVHPPCAISNTEHQRTRGTL